MGPGARGCTWTDSSGSRAVRSVACTPAASAAQRKAQPGPGRAPQEKGADEQVSTQDDYVRSRCYSNTRFWRGKGFGHYLSLLFKMASISCLFFNSEVERGKSGP